MYSAGALKDGTLYRLSRDKAMESVEYECADDKVTVKVWNRAVDRIFRLGGGKGARASSNRPKAAFRVRGDRPNF